MKKQILKIDQMLRLKKLGVDTSKASMVLIYKDNDGNELPFDESETASEVTEYLLDAETGDYDHSYRSYCGVFTLQDIFEMLPTGIADGKGGHYLFKMSKRTDVDGWVMNYESRNREWPKGEIKGQNILDCAYEVLITLTMRGHLPKCWLI